LHILYGQLRSGAVEYGGFHENPSRKKGRKPFFLEKKNQKTFTDFS
jgi:hypothetical protein